jgi:hypothetical protein
MEHSALNKLHELRDQIDALADQAAEIVRENFPKHWEFAEDYCVFQMTSSWNDYNQTFSTLIADIGKDLEDA